MPLNPASIRCIAATTWWSAATSQVQNKPRRHGTRNQPGCGRMTRAARGQVTTEPNRVERTTRTHGTLARQERRVVRPDDDLLRLLWPVHPDEILGSGSSRPETHLLHSRLRAPIPELLPRRCRRRDSRKRKAPIDAQRVVQRLCRAALGIHAHRPANPQQDSPRSGRKPQLEFVEIGRVTKLRKLA